MLKSNLKIQKERKYREYHTAFVIEPHYLKTREMQDALNVSVGYGIKTSEELKEVKRDTGAKLNVAERKLAAAEYDLESLSKISGKIKEMANIKAELNPMSAEQKRDCRYKTNI